MATRPKRARLPAMTNDRFGCTGDIIYRFLLGRRYGSERRAGRLVAPGCLGMLERGAHFESDHARPALTRQRPDVRIGVLAGGVEDKAGIDARELNMIEDIERLDLQRQEAALFAQRNPLAEAHIP